MSLIRSVKSEDAFAVCEIYNYYVQNTTITFEEKVVTVDQMKERLQHHSELLPWFVYEENNEVLGYAYAANWRTRSAYRYSVEATVYIANQHTGRSIGSKLYSELVETLKKLGVHCVIGGIALPNPASISLHEKFEFRKVAHFEEVGLKMDKWIDVGYWQLILNER